MLKFLSYNSVNLYRNRKEKLMWTVIIAGAALVWYFSNQ